MAHTLRYDAGASAYDRLTGRWSRMYIPAVMKAANVTSGSQVLDVATGTGDAAIVAADLVGRGGRVVAVDISGPMLREAEAKAGRRQIEFLQGDAQHLPFPEASFDAVLCLFGLMFVPDPVAALQSFRTVLRPERTVVATCWDRPERAPFAGLVANALASQSPEERDELCRPFSLCDAQKSADLFKAAGFTDVRVELHTFVSNFRSFSDDFWEPIEAGGGRLGQAYLALGPRAREAVRSEVLGRLPVRTATDPFSIQHSAWVIAAASA